MKEPNSTPAEVRPCADAPPPATKARAAMVNEAHFLRVTVVHLREKIEALNIAQLDGTLDKIDGVSEVLDDINNELTALLGESL